MWVRTSDRKASVIASYALPNARGGTTEVLLLNPSDITFIIRGKVEFFFVHSPKHIALFLFTLGHFGHSLVVFSETGGHALSCRDC